MPKRRHQRMQAMSEPVSACITGLVKHTPNVADQVVDVPLVLSASIPVVEAVEPAVVAPAIPDLSRLTAADAEWLDGLAASKRAAAVSTDRLFAVQAEAEAAGLEAVAAALRDPVARGLPALHQGRGGETAPLDDPDMPWKRRELAQAVAASPSALAADASLQRLVLARDADVLVTAVEIAHDAGAETAAEKALAHQLAAAHRVGMGLFGTASDNLHKHQVAPHAYPGALAEAMRAAAVGARVLSAFAQGALALDRLRNGSRQVVQVQHVTVNDGGQAVVAGSVAPGGVPAATAASRRGGRAK